jgi:hypothetical protein
VKRGMRPKCTVGFSRGFFAEMGAEPDKRNTTIMDNRILKRRDFTKPHLTIGSPKGSSNCKINIF